MAGAGFPTPFGRMTDGRNQGADQMASQMTSQMASQMTPQMASQMAPQMGQGMMPNQIGGMSDMRGISGDGMSNGGGFPPMMSNDKMVMAS